MDGVGIDVASRHDGLIEFNDGGLGRAGHDGAEVALREPELQIADVIGGVGMYERVVGG